MSVANAGGVAAATGLPATGHGMKLRHRVCGMANMMAVLGGLAHIMDYDAPALGHSRRRDAKHDGGSQSGDDLCFHGI